MAISAALTVSPAAPGHGATVTAVYTVQGNDPGPPQEATVSGVATIGGNALNVTTTLELPGVKPLTELFAVPVCPGLSFAPDPSDSSGATFTALVP